MDEAIVRAKITRMLKDSNHVSITQTDAAKCPQCGRIIYPAPGRPDVICDPKFVIEVKTLRPNEKSFPFSRIEDHQRQWLTWFITNPERFSYLALGIIRGHGSFEMLDHLYIVPWQIWLRTEKKIRKYQKSIPFVAGKGFRKELQENNLDIKHLFEQYELNLDMGLISPLVKGELR